VFVIVKKQYKQTVEMQGGRCEHPNLKVLVPFTRQMDPALLAEALVLSFDFGSVFVRSALLPPLKCSIDMPGSDF
jgi:hypothetical protein